jgi:hypothetical protein
LQKDGTKKTSTNVKYQCCGAGAARWWKYRYYYILFTELKIFLYLTFFDILGNRLRAGAASELFYPELDPAKS